jgi:hypothetical protein
MAAGLLGLHPPLDSEAIAAACGITVPDHVRHTALGDALYAERLYLVVTQVAGLVKVRRARGAALADAAVLQVMADIHTALRGQGDRDG